MAVKLTDKVYNEGGSPVQGAVAQAVLTNGTTTNVVATDITDTKGIWAFDSSIAGHQADLADPATGFWYDVQINVGMQYRLRYGAIKAMMSMIYLAQTIVLGATNMFDASVGALKIPFRTGDPAGPTGGQIVFRSDTKDLKVYDGSAWITVPNTPDNTFPPAKIKMPLDIPDWFRSTGAPTAKASTGAGIEVYYSAGTSVVLSYNRAGAAYIPLQLQGSLVTMFSGPAQQYSAQLDNAGTFVTSGRMTAGLDMVSSNGNFYLGNQGDTLLQRAGVNIVRVPYTVYFGDSSVQLFRSPQIGGTTTPLIVNNPGGGLWIQGSTGLTLYTPTDPAGGGQAFRVIEASNRPAATYGGGEIHMGLRLYVDGDIWAGTYVHGISFLTTPSARAFKENMVVFPDDQCMARVRDPSMEVFQYEVPPPIAGSPVRPTTTDIGFDAADVYRVAPEFAGIDADNQPMSVAYGQMAALLWGAVRQLDARVQALE